MNIIQIKYIGVALFISLIVATGALYLNKNNAQAQKTEIPKVERQLFFPNDTVSIPLAVSGILSATNAITVYARTAGVLESIPIEEGDTVKKGTLLFSQDTSVLDSSLALSVAQGNKESTTALSQYSNQLSIRNKLNNTERFASTSAILQKESYQGTTEELQESLRLTLDSAITQLIIVLDFLDEHRPLLPAKAVDTYTDVLVTLFGSQPSYLNDGLVRRTLKSETVVTNVYDLKEDSNIDHLVTVAEDVANQFSEVSKILVDAESEFLDESKVSTDSALYATYLSHRRGMTDMKKSILSAQISLISKLPQEKKSLLAAKHAQIIAKIDEEEAINQTKYAEKLMNDVSAINNAQVAYLQSQRQLSQAIAPFDAVVERVLIDEGQFALPGEPIAVLQGSGGVELSVSIPVDFVPLLEEGQAFSIDNEVVGHVNRFSPVTSNGIIVVFISLDTSKYLPGQVLTGVLKIESENAMITKIPREYIQFATNGPFVYTKNRKKIPITILYDAMDDVYVEKKDIFKEGIVSTKIITL